MKIVYKKSKRFIQHSELFPSTEACLFLNQTDPKTDYINTTFFCTELRKLFWETTAKSRTTMQNSIHRCPRDYIRLFSLTRQICLCRRVSFSQCSWTMFPYQNQTRKTGMKFAPVWTIFGPKLQSDIVSFVRLKSWFIETSLRRCLVNADRSDNSRIS